ncbi:MAG TPA: hypothetical protein VHG69_12325 [Thermoleophilaceae bacterium]|nr:hypothetical protein [Thermoleophilaceae bacterium]
MIEPRVYRAAFVPALLAVVLAMFSLESRPGPLAQGLAADVLFEGELAAGSAAALARRFPDRRAGRPGNRAASAFVADALRRRGFSVESDRFAHAGRQLVNVIGRRAGRSRSQLAVVAARDARGVPDVSGSAADTAALLELARAFEGRPTERTLLLASVDGSTLGEVGAERLAERLGDPGFVQGVLVVSNLGSPERRGSFVVAWSNDTGRAGIGLQRTVADSIREELEEDAGATSWMGQLFRMSFPLGIGAQSVFLERGFDSVRISGSGELPRGGPLDQDVLGGLGRATLRSVTALDEGARPARGPDSYVTAVSQVMPGWVIQLLAITFLLPVIITSVDAFARARRRHVPVGPWLRWLATWIAPFIAALAAAGLLALAGATPDPPPNPVAPSDNPLDSAAAGVLLGVGAAAALAFMAARALSRRSGDLGDPSEPGAASALALVAAGTALLLWLVNPYAALLVVPAAHLWMLATLVDPRPPRRARAAMVAAGLLPLALVALYYLIALRIDPITGAWYLLLLVSGGAVDLPLALLGCIGLGCLAATVAIVRAAPDPEPPAEEERPTVFGPGAHAGPGALGGTQSALRR